MKTAAGRQPSASAGLHAALTTEAPPPAEPAGIAAPRAPLGRATLTLLQMIVSFVSALTLLLLASLVMLVLALLLTLVSLVTLAILPRIMAIFARHRLLWAFGPLGASEVHLAQTLLIARLLFVNLARPVGQMSRSGDCASQRSGGARVGLR
ncbi:unnamed protein product [Prorocentrum cordatum]|uniref:Uncharacterized protein n=1 Tax=Prorocentrum cordatum TaxID=2364126 RepID=A0ABN9WVC3_9DINO|nr:unnamed protein product [Polarella glacialis]